MAESGVPDVKTQKEELQLQLNKPLVKGDIWYLLDIKWIKQWKAYVGFDPWDTYHVGEDSAHPGPIDNSPIFQEGNQTIIEHSMIDDLDYVLIPADGWNKLVSWYGLVDGQLHQPRKVIEEGIYSKNLTVEVYLWNFKLCEYSQLDDLITKQFSRSDTVGQLEEIMREEFSIDENREVRLWNRYMANMYEPLNKPNHTLQDAGLYQGQVVVIEQRNDDGTWPRENGNNVTSTRPKQKNIAKERKVKIENQA